VIKQKVDVVFARRLQGLAWGLLLFCMASDILPVDGAIADLGAAFSGDRQ